jgi:mRNA degradation ribonuclease J1/J2
MNRLRSPLLCHSFQDSYGLILQNDVQALAHTDAYKIHTDGVHGQVLFRPNEQQQLVCIRSPEAGDVTLLGTEGAATLDAQQIARTAGTISYNILSSISARVKRVYV